MSLLETFVRVVRALSPAVDRRNKLRFEINAPGDLGQRSNRVSDVRQDR